MQTKTCCATGHRIIPNHKLEFITQQLTYEIEQAIGDGYTTFISGMADGIDLLFAQLVIEQQAKHPELLLQAAIPYRKRINTHNEIFHQCLKKCNEVRVLREEYSGDCFFNRNMYMVSASCRVIAVYDGRKTGGTFCTINYALLKNREVIEIRV